MPPTATEEFTNQLVGEVKELAKVVLYGSSFCSGIAVFAVLLIVHREQSPDFFVSEKMFLTFAHAVLMSNPYSPW